MSVEEFPYLLIEDSVSAPFWEGTHNSKLLIQYCESCHLGKCGHVD
jgi:hypothetical protein